MKPKPKAEIDVLQLVQNYAAISGDSDLGVPTPASTNMNEDQSKEEEVKEKDYLELDLTRTIKPIMHPEVERDARAAMAMYLHRSKWRAWGMHKVREQGTAILLKGPPGTGKTSIVKWMCKLMKKKLKKLDVSTICSGEPGASEREVIEFFDFCRANDCAVFMDECDQLLTNRDEISADGRTWQLSTMEQIMVQMSVFQNPVFAATNHEGLMDPALADRFIYVVQVGRPDFARRTLIWKQKWPDLFPLRLKERNIRHLAKIDLSGRQIENVLVAVANTCIATQRKPTWEMFEETSLKETKKQII